jgi:hypothetical protein
VGLVNPQRIPLNVIITGESGHDVADVTGDALHVTLYGATGPISATNPLPTTGGGGGGSSPNVNLIQVGGANIFEGQTTMANSVPVVIASDQTPIGITGPVNVAQFGGNPVVTGVGPAGPGIPRVTVSNDSVVGLTGPVGITGPITANQGTPAVIANSWPIEITNGATGPAAVKGASTVALATDPALVVTTNTSVVSNIPAQTLVNASSSLILAANTARRECTVANTGTTAIYLGLGQIPTITAYHIPLASCTNANDGSGGTYITDLWKGSILAIGATGGATCVVTEFS